MANYSEFQAANSQRQDEPASNDGGQLDTAGQAILKLLHKAAGVVEADQAVAEVAGGAGLIGDALVAVVVDEAVLDHGREAVPVEPDRASLVVVSPESCTVCG